MLSLECSLVEQGEVSRRETANLKLSIAVGKERLSERARFDGLRGEGHFNSGTSRFAGESSVNIGETGSHVAGGRASGIERSPSWAANLTFVGDGGGVKKGSSSLSSMFRTSRQLRLLRGDPGVLGDDQPSVLIVFVGDKGGVVYPDSDVVESSSVTYIAKITEG